MPRTLVALAALALLCDAASVCAQDARSGSLRFGPPSPTAASLGAFGEVPVTLYTGTPAVDIPLHTVRGRTRTLAVRLRYHGSGIRVETIPGWVGAGWALEAGGVITRSVRGLPDDQDRGSGQGGYLYSAGRLTDEVWNSADRAAVQNWLGGLTTQLPDQLYRYIEDVTAGDVDNEPDSFFFNLDGRSGRLFLTPDGQVRTVPHLPWKIAYETSGLSVEGGGTFTGIHRWTITTEDGTAYVFEDLEYAYDTNQAPCTQCAWVSSWYLSRVESPEGDDVVRLAYAEEPGVPAARSLPAYEEQLVVTSASAQGAAGCLVSGQTVFPNLHKVKRLRLESVASVFDSLVFAAAPRTGYMAPDEYRLDRIEVYGLDRRFVKRFELSHRPPEAVFGYRLFLEQVREWGAAGRALPPYRFRYEGEGGVAFPLPPYGSNRTDHWGFHNNARNAGTRLAASMYRDRDTGRYEFFEGADRRPQPDYARTGILTRITYPTGGYAAFTFEEHDYGRIGARLVDSDLAPQQPVSVAAFGTGEEVQAFTVASSGRRPVGVSLGLAGQVPKTRGCKDPVTGKNAPCVQVRILDEAGAELLAVRPGRGAVDERHGVDLLPGRYTAHFRVLDPEARVAADLAWQPPSRFARFNTPQRLRLGVDVEASAATAPTGSSFSRPFTVANEVDPAGALPVVLRADFFLYESSNDACPGECLAVEVLRDGALVARYEPSTSGGGAVDRRTWTLTLVPGTYTLRATGNSTTSSVNASVSWDNRVVADRRPAGGVRVRRIVTHDGMDPSRDVVRTFEYTLEDGRSSGVLVSRPHYYYVKDVGACRYVSRSAAPVGGLGTTQGAFLGYSRVTVLHGEAADGGSGAEGGVVHTFLAADRPEQADDDLGLDEQDLWPFAARTSRDHRRGLAVARMERDADGRLQRRAGYDHFFSVEDESDSDPEGPFFAARALAVKRSPTSQSGLQDVYFKRYHLYSAWHYVRAETLRTYAQEGGAPVNATRSFAYDPDLLQLVRTEETDSEGRLRRTTYRYAAQVYDGPGEMRDRNMLTQRYAETVEAETGDVEARSWTTWAPFSHDGATYWRPRSAWSWAGDGSLDDATAPADPDVNDPETRRLARYDAYDRRGNLLARTDALGRTTRLAYADSLRAALVTEIETPNGDVHAFGYRTDTGQLAGVRDANGAEVRYAYDDLHRLLEVRNADGVPVERHAYAYAADAGGIGPALPNRIATTTFRSATDSTRSVVFLDGLGRTVQTRAEGGEEALVTAVTYDAEGRVHRQYRPYAGSTASGYDPDYDARAVAYYTDTACGPAEPATTSCDPATVSVDVGSGWSLVSVPVEADSMHYLSLFPEASARPSASIDGAYVSMEEMRLGLGYWMLFEEPRTYALSGCTASAQRVRVDEGWNLVGPFDQPVQADRVLGIGTSVTSSFYGHNGAGYYTASTLEPGKGYWVLVSADGLLDVSGEGSSEPLATTSASLAEPRESESPAWPRLVVTDARGRSVTLHLALDEGVLESEYLLPPPPPEEAPDVRFGTGRRVMAALDADAVVNLREQAFPLSIRIENLRGQAVRLRPGGGGGPRTLREGEPAVLETPTGSLLLGLVLEPAARAAWRADEADWALRRRADLASTEESLAATAADTPGDVCYCGDSSRPYTEFRYLSDPTRRIRAVYAPGQTTPAATVYRTDPSGGVRLHETTDESGRAVRTAIDRLGRVVRIDRASASGPETATTRFAYDLVGNLTQVESPEAVADPAFEGRTVYRYDPQGRLIERRTPESGRVRFFYDRAGNRRFVEDENHRGTGFTFTTYDALGRPLVSGTAPGNPSGFDPDAGHGFEADTGAWLSVQHYDGPPPAGAFPWNRFEGLEGLLDTERDHLRGRRAATAQRSGGWWRIELHAYDAEGRVRRTRVRTDSLPALDTELTYAYDRQGNLTRRSVRVGPDSVAHHYAYDAIGRLSRVYVRTGGALPDRPDLTYAYTAGDAVRSIGIAEQADGRYRVRLPVQYTMRDRVHRIGDPSASGGLFAAAYCYGPSGLILRADCVNPQAERSAEKRFSYAYRYDGLRRLTQADFSAGGVEDDRYDVRNVSYDRDGNLRTLERYDADGLRIDNLTFQYAGAGGWLTGVTDGVPERSEGWDAESGAFGYDGNGNVVSATGSHVFSGAVYDTRNLPVRVTTPSGTTAYRYAFDGWRMYRRTDAFEEAVILDGGLTAGVFEKRDGAWALRHWNILADGAVVGRVEGGVRRYYVRDARGSTRAVVDEGGVVRAAYDYYPFGLALPGRSLIAGSPTREGFTGKARDPETGLVYFGARYLMPALGRWTAVDPLRHRYPDLSPYAYAFNDPVLWNDPDGRCPDCGDGVSDAYVGARVIKTALFDVKHSAQNLVLNSWIGRALRPADPGMQWKAGYAADAGGREVFRTRIEQVPRKGAGAELADNLLDLVNVVSFGQAPGASLLGRVPGGATQVTRTSRIVLGHAPRYLELANELNARHMNIPQHIWETFSPARQWKAVQTFLDRAIARADEVVLSVHVDDIRPGSILEQEVAYLRSKGYEVSEDGFHLFPSNP